MGKRQSKKKTAEDNVYNYIVKKGYPAPLRQQQIIEGRRYKADFYWPQHKMVLEVEGGIWTGGRHVRPQGFLGDMEKYNLYAYHGYVLYRCAPQHLHDGTLDEILAMMFE